jgi:hypothetical protein
MRLGAQLVGDLRKMLAEELRAGERAAMAAIRTETAEVKAELRQQVTTAFAGNARGIANAWRSMVFPRTGQSLRPAGLVFTKVPKVIDAFERGALIRAKGGRKFLAIPTGFNAARGRRGRGEKGMRVTPAQMVASGFSAALQIRARLCLVPATPRRGTGRTAATAPAVDCRRRHRNRHRPSPWPRGLGTRSTRARHGADVSAAAAGEAHKTPGRKGRGRAWPAPSARAFCGGLGHRGRETAMSLREAALTALFARLNASLAARNPAPVIRRNETVPQRLPQGGLVVLRDGESVSETPILSPLAYAIEHSAEIEVLAADNALLDALLVAIAAGITADPMLGGAVEWAQPGSADIEDVEFEGAASARAASLPVTLFFTVAGSPLA